MDKFLGGILWVGFLIVAGITIMCWKAFVITKHWGWFLTLAPLNFAQITMGSALGMVIIMGLLAPHISEPKDDDKTVTILKLIVYGGLVPAISLGLGWLIHNYVL